MQEFFLDLEKFATFLELPCKIHLIAGSDFPGIMITLEIYAVRQDRLHGGGGRLLCAVSPGPQGEKARRPRRAARRGNVRTARLNP